MRVVFALAVFAAAAFMLYGWGWAARRLLRARETNWPATAASGMAALVFLGGMLNLARLAYPWALGCAAVGGIALGVIALKNWAPKNWARKKWEMSILSRVLIPVAVLVFTIVTQAPPRAYNFHDDFQKYFAHPVRMLETGTVFGSPLNDIGLDTLGGQALLDGFAVAFFPIQYINGVGAAFALFLCMMLASQFKSIFTSTLATLSVFIINPQYVNISALYTGSLLIMAAILEESAAMTGLLYAGLIALKSSFVLFVAVHLAATRRVKAGVFAALFLTPWILLHAPHYVQFLQAGPAIADHGVRPVESFNSFSIEPLDYGATPLAYTLLMIAVALCGVLRNKVDAIAMACFAMSVAYLIMMYVSGPRNAGYAQAIRYFAPFAIAIAPIAFGSAEQLKPRWITLAAAAVPLLAFVPSLRDRVEQAVHSGSVLAFSWLAPDPEYIAYSQQVLYGDMRGRVQAAQAKVPAGDAVVVWINTPFYLNYARNRVADVEPGAGLIAPWSKIPPDARYFIFEYSGYATVDEADYVEAMAEGPDFMRRVSAARLDMTRRLTEMMRSSREKLYDDGSIAVFTAEPSHFGSRK
jgi:hypothetical protein